MSEKPHILFTKVLSEHRKTLLEQMVRVSEVNALDPVQLPIIEMPEAPEWIIITSPHAIESVRTHLENGWGKDAKWATVGFRAGDKVSELGISPTLRAEHARALTERLPESGTALYLCGKDRTSYIEDYMSSHDWEWQTLETYWTQATHPQVDLNEYDAVAFFSPKNADSVLRLNEWPENGFAMAIGPTTANALRERGIEPKVVPSSPDVLLMTQQFLEIHRNGSTE